MATNDALGDRMKSLEMLETGRKFLPGIPIYARIDGRGFSKFTKGMNRPYDERMSNAMVDTTKSLVDATHAKIGYVQSDEISLVWIPSEHGHNWFDGKVMKMSSVLAGLATSAFIKSLIVNFDNWKDLLDKEPHFDARVINVPSEAEAANMLLWRNLDATKNAISMAAHHYYNHKELQSKTGSEKQELLFQKGINFNDYPYFFKRGTWVKRLSTVRTLSAEELDKIPVKHRPDASTMVTRTEVVSFDLPPLNKVTNRVDVLFNGADPL